MQQVKMDLCVCSWASDAHEPYHLSPPPIHNTAHLDCNSLGDVAGRLARAGAGAGAERSGGHGSRWAPEGGKAHQQLKLGSGSECGEVQLKSFGWGVCKVNCGCGVGV